MNTPLLPILAAAVLALAALSPAPMAAPVQPQTAGSRQAQAAQNERILRLELRAKYAELDVVIAKGAESVAIAAIKRDILSIQSRMLDIEIASRVQSARAGLPAKPMQMPGASQNRQPQPSWAAPAPGAARQTAPASHAAQPKSQSAPPQTLKAR